MKKNIIVVVFYICLVIIIITSFRKNKNENDNIVELELRGYLSATDGNYRPLGTFTVIVYTKGDKLYGSII